MKLAFIPLIMRSKVPLAKSFQNLVCGTILPFIRKTGKFEIDNQIKQLEDKVSKLAITNETLEKTIKFVCEERAPLPEDEKTQHRFALVQLGVNMLFDVSINT